MLKSIMDELKEAYCQDGIWFWEDDSIITLRDRLNWLRDSHGTCEFVWNEITVGYDSVVSVACFSKFGLEVDSFVVE